MRNKSASIENIQIINFKPINMTDELKPKKTRTPKNVENITNGALSLPLNERVALVNKLKESIQAEVETINEAAKQASAIANGLGA